MVQWQYDSTTSHRIVELVAILDKKGKQGWELVTLIEVKVKTGESRRFMGIMKRPTNKER